VGEDPVRDRRLAPIQLVADEREVAADLVRVGGRKDDLSPEWPEAADSEPDANEQLSDGDDPSAAGRPDPALAFGLERFGVAGGRGADRLQGLGWDAGLRAGFDGG
jgi:hypothetical protein